MLDRAEIAVLRRLYKLRGIEAINSALLRRTRWGDGPLTILLEFGAVASQPHGVVHGPIVLHNADARGYINLHFGAGCHVGRLVTIDLAAPVHIGADATISMGCTLLTHTSAGGRTDAVAEVLSPLRIGDGAYLGANVTVLPGCHIGARTVVAAGAVVTRPLPPDARAAGVPARLLASKHVARERT